MQLQNNQLILWLCPALHWQFWNHSQEGIGDSPIHPTQQWEPLKKIFKSTSVILSDEDEA